MDDLPLYRAAGVAIEAIRPTTESMRAGWDRYLANRPGPTEDPRSDLADDSARWSALLTAAHADPEDPECWGVLHGLRCLGARLEVAGNGLRITPGEIAPDEYAALRERYLVPIAARVTRLLRVDSAPDGLPSGDRERM
ncbi:MAG: hypothetical protein GXX94_10865 [Chloroflexi bacterium]|nr:hypothetical protein [Chloroflexota bacterium]